MSPIPALLTALSIAGAAYAAAPALAQNAPINNAPITNVPNLMIPDALPDLVVSKYTFALTCAPDKKSLTATYAVTVVNKGPKANANLSVIPLFQLMTANWGTTIGPANLEKPLVPPLAPPTAGGPAIMKPGQTSSASMTIKNIPHHKKGSFSYAQYALWVRVDPVQGVPESNEENNLTRQFFKDPCPK
jgi:hypothetical protein